ncbi:MAG: arylsulfotransferase family protein [Pseudomonadota bacterium]
MIDRIAKAAFLLGAIMLATLYGVYAARYEWFPSPQLSLAVITYQDIKTNWKNDLALEPTRHLVDAREQGRSDEFEEFRMLNAGAAQEGLVMIAGLSPDQDESVHAVSLYDETGELVHRWAVNYAALDPEGLRPQNVMLHGMEIFPDGSMALAFDAGNRLARIDACGEPLWTTEGGYHHIVTEDSEDGLWSWREETLVHLDAATGEVTKTLDLREEMMSVNGGQEGIFAIRTVGREDGLDYENDAFHANDVEPLLPEMAAAFPMFEAGDLLISLRELNLVAVIDPDDGHLIWWRHGPWHKQHDPDFQPDGTITVFDNRMGLGESRILRIDPATDVTTVIYEGSEEAPFYTYQRGKHQVLSNGNILITESEEGRVFEAAADGSLVWEREIVWDADRNLIITEARSIPSDYFEPDALDCSELRISALVN